MLAPNEPERNTEEHLGNSYTSGEHSFWIMGKLWNIKAGNALFSENSSVSGITMSATLLKYLLHYCN